jgi:hypothetical protein
MRPFTSLPRSALMALAVFYAVTAVGYLVVGSYQSRVAPGGDPGFSARYLPSTGFFEVTHITADGPAQQGGLRVGDLVLAIDDVPARGISFYKMTMSGKLNQILRFTVKRSGIQPGGGEQLTLPVSLSPPPAPAFRNMTTSRHIGILGAKMKRKLERRNTSPKGLVSDVAVIPSTLSPIGASGQYIRLAQEGTLDKFSTLGSRLRKLRGARKNRGSSPRVQRSCLAGRVFASRAAPREEF